MDLFNNLEKQLKKIVGGADRSLKKGVRGDSRALKKTSRKNEKTLRDSSKANEKALKKYVDFQILGGIRNERKAVSKKMKDAVMTKYNGTCNHRSCRRNKAPLDIHHKNFKNSDNKKSNLVVLCPNHHREIHEKKFKKVYATEWRKKKGKKK